MEVQEAIRLAKGYVTEVFGDEKPTNVGLEEIEFDDADQIWNVTIGFSRPMLNVKSAVANLVGEDPMRQRTYRVVRIRDDDGKMVAIKLRDMVTSN